MEVISPICFKLSFTVIEEAQKTLEESMAMSMADHQDIPVDFYRSRNGTVNTNSTGGGTVGKRSTMSRKQQAHHQPPAVVGRSPPRPSPASVPYNSDEESLKGYDENPDDSSVTEKPSEMSSSESQVLFYSVICIKI